MAEVVCLCPTYGRFQLLRRALTCFLTQDYPDKHLLICNDAPVPIKIDPHWADQVTVWNRHAAFRRLGKKRQRLLERIAGQSPIAAHWDDDDLYLPWHLSRAIAALIEQDAWCVVPNCCWKMNGRNCKRVTIHPKGKSAAYIFRPADCLASGGYREWSSGGETHAWRPRVVHDRKLREYQDAPPAFAWVPGGTWAHSRRRMTACNEHHAGNQDFGNGQDSLTPMPLYRVGNLLLHAGHQLLGLRDTQWLTEWYRPL